jgi:dTDP-4-dehydrorhamnose 3,5-epimerase
MLLRRKLIGDSRGYLERLYCTEELRGLIPGKGIVQINHTMTAKRGTVRGMHFQRPPYAETKFVSCLRGEVFDVAVDLRPKSPTFLRWHAQVLTGSGHETLVIPEGFAHGYQSLSDDCEMLYLHTAAYHPDAEDALNARDPALAISWPEAISEVSPRDASHPMITKDFRGVVL